MAAAAGARTSTGTRLIKFLSDGDARSQLLGRGIGIGQLLGTSEDRFKNAAQIKVWRARHSSSAFPP